ncbi:dihydrodipicolinate synthase family protein [Agrobacterium vitis]|uniref:Dihydrodipicolinate synthase family protein n=1 Tax=Agrobacterium vitis TaxID=373 RepID=A0A1S2E0M4_AGRVI|nr:dihydrodipicolinate synthase family protein [Agrobacterium vitis]MUO80902.1 dihydrodipicolinate synthase family protein [Agrobacterium vitis]MUO94810.1 dihydrodipicolinate synthase family protein [Agrobacterium vitis]MUP05428.1 dihydrodipicolinate synthase family protein [Agrobacterium vitis]MUZ81578.1 dihydrodipicolinate synthase family protein [Agrobacterium vitis]MVA56674.1 dihydrodipicolinate synthase family protein [Agrobacterium vitis]
MPKPFRGVFTVMITPIDADGSVNLPALAAFTDWQIREGIHGLIPLGSTGEFLSLSQDDRDAVARTVIETAAGRVPVLIGTGAEDTREAVRLARNAQAMGADGIMVIPPFYCTPTEDELVEHYRAIAASISIPIMVYNNPATANVDLKPEILARIAQIDGCDYVKESTLEVTRIRDIVRLAGPSMTPFGGILGFESFVMGAQGWVAVASNIAPGPMSRIFTLAADEQKYDEARALYLEWLPLIQAVGGQAYVAGSKSLLNHMGFAAGSPLPPRLPLPQAQDADMKSLVERFGLRFEN